MTSTGGMNESGQRAGDVLLATMVHVRCGLTVGRLRLTTGRLASRGAVSLQPRVQIRSRSRASSRRDVVAAATPAKPVHRLLQALTPPRSRTECNAHDMEIHSVHALFTHSSTRGGPQREAPPLSRSPPPLSVIIFSSLFPFPFPFPLPSRPLARCCSDQPDARRGRSCASFPGGTLGSPRVWNKIEQTNMHTCDSRHAAYPCAPRPCLAYQCPAIVGWSGKRVGLSREEGLDVVDDDDGEAEAESYQ